MNSLYVGTGRSTKSGVLEHVEFDDYDFSQGILIDAKARTKGKSSIYNVSKGKGDWKKDIVRRKVYKRKLHAIISCEEGNLDRSR
jgi:hypothetical protein